MLSHGHKATLLALLLTGCAVAPTPGPGVYCEPARGAPYDCSGNPLYPVCDQDMRECVSVTDGGQ